MSRRVVGSVRTGFAPEGVMRFLRAGWKYATHLAVLAVLGGLGWWGHRTHWHVPSPAALFGTEPPPPKNKAEVGPRLVMAPGSAFPAVVFPSAKNVRTAGLSVESVARRNLDEVVTTNAVVEYDRAHVANLAPRAPGRVVRVFKRLGQPVVAGEVLALLDSDVVGQAKADYLLETGIAAYKAQVVKRLKGVGIRVVPERAILEAESTLKEAELRRFAAQQKLVNLGVTVKLPEGEVVPPEEMARRLQFAGIPDEVVARLDPRPATANLIPLVAPFGGVVTANDMVVGELERPDRSAMTVADPGEVWVWLSVRKEDASRLALGQAVEFRPDGGGPGATGTLTWISTEIDPKTRTVQARADVKNPYPATAPESVGPPLPAARPRAILVNSFGTGRVSVGRAENALVVPEAALQMLEKDGDLVRVVFVADPDGMTFRPRAVRVGLSAGGYAQVTDGVSDGDRVVTANSFVLKSELAVSTVAAGG